MPDKAIFMNILGGKEQRMPVVKLPFAFVQRVLMSMKAIYLAKIAQQSVMMVGVLCSLLDLLYFIFYF